MKTKYLIIGAGISGLTFANYCKGDYIILEKDSEIGGYAKTIRNNNYVWDYAGHFFHFKTDEFKELFLKDLLPDDIIYQTKKTNILYKNKLIDYPFQTNIHELKKNEFIDCLYDLFNKKEKENYDSFLDMLYGKFGKSIVEKFLKPYNEKLYAIDLTKLDVDAMGRFFPYADKEAIINNMKNHSNKSYNDTFMYPKNGAGVFTNVLYNKLNKQNVLLNEEVVKINFTNKIVYTKTGKEINYDYLINTSPLNKFLQFFDNNFSNELSYNKVLVFNLGYDKKSKFKNEHWIYIPSKESNYYRIGFYDNILNADKLSMYVEIGFNKDDNINVDLELKKTLNNLQKDGIIDTSMKLVDYSTIIMDPAYVHINKITDKKIRDFLKQKANDRIYSIGRYGSWTYCSMEDCMVEAKKLAEIIK